MIVLDTTALVYPVGTEHPAREPTRRLVDAIGAGRVHASTTAEVVQEFAHVYARRRSRPAAARHARRYAALLSPLLPITADDLEFSLSLFERHPQLGPFDALVAAVAITHRADALVSADSGFAAVPRLNHIAPGTAAFDRLVG